MFEIKSVFNSLNFNDFRNKNFLLNIFNNLSKLCFPQNLKMFENNYFKLLIIDFQNDKFYEKRIFIIYTYLIYRFQFLRINIISTLFIIFWFYISSETNLKFNQYIISTTLNKIITLFYKFTILKFMTIFTIFIFMTIFKSNKIQTFFWNGYTYTC